ARSRLQEVGCQSRRHAGPDPERPSAVFLDALADQLEDVVLVLTRRSERVPRYLECSSAGNAAVEPNHRTPSGPAGSDDPRGFVLDDQLRADPEALLRLAGFLDHERAVEAVRLADPADDHEVAGAHVRA